MGQAMARKEVREGLRLYNQHSYDAAIRKWKRALHKISSRSQRFATLSYLAQAHADFGRYRDMLAYAVMQIDIANETENSGMRAEAYLNLARANESLCEYHKAVSYSRHCLQNQPTDPRVHGYVYLTQGKAYLGFSNFTKTLEMLEYSMRIAKQSEDTTLELQIYTTLGNLFTLLQDYEKGLGFHLKAAELAKSFKVCDPSSRYQRITCYNLSLPYRKLGRADRAMECCQEALRMGLAEGDKPVQARALSCLADVHRKQSDAMQAYGRYEAAIQLMVEMGDRYGQVEVIAGMAKCMVRMKEISKVCECKALEYNIKALDLASSIGNKMLKCHRRMEVLYSSLGDVDLVEEHSERQKHLLEEMDLVCTVCDHPMGDVPDKLELLSCFHIVHNRCAAHIKSQSLSPEPDPPTNDRSYCKHCRKITARVASLDDEPSDPT